MLAETDAMTSDRNHPSAAFWITVALLAVLAYPLSFGPACWWFSADSGTGVRVAPAMYWPIGWLAEWGPDCVYRVIFRYAMLIGDENLVIPNSPSGGGWFLP